MIRELCFLISNESDADYMRAPLNGIKMSSAVNRLPAFNPFSRRAKFFVSSNFRVQHWFYYHLLKHTGKLWTPYDEIELLFERRFTEPQKFIFIAHDRILCSIWSEHLSRYDDLNAAVLIIPTERRHEEYRPLYSRLQKRLTEEPVSVLPKLIVVGNCTNLDLIKTLRLAYPNAKICVFVYDDLKSFDFFIENSVTNFKRKLESLNVEFWYYGHGGADEHKLIFQPNAVNFEYLGRLAAKNAEPKFIFYAGAACGRFSVLMIIISAALKLGFRIKFYLVSLTDQQKAICRNVNKEMGYEGIICDKRVSYHDYVLELSKSCVVIDSFKKYPEEGYSYRIPEALAMSKKLISNRSPLRSEPFYNDKFIYLFDNTGISQERLEMFLSSDPDVRYEVTEKWDLKNVLKTVYGGKSPMEELK